MATKRLVVVGKIGPAFKSAIVSECFRCHGKVTTWNHDVIKRSKAFAKSGGFHLCDDCFDKWQKAFMERRNVNA